MSPSQTSRFSNIFRQTVEFVSRGNIYGFILPNECCTSFEIMCVMFSWTSQGPRVKSASLLNGLTYTDFVAEHFTFLYDRHVFWWRWFIPDNAPVALCVWITGNWFQEYFTEFQIFNLLGNALTDNRT